MPITLSPDARKQRLASLKRYAAENLDEEIFCLAEIGAVVYNQARLRLGPTNMAGLAAPR
jgi:hypothetical protein